ncbi:MAG: PLP-dependent aminotransferase family protein [Pseudoruegeria sp.]
MFKQIHDLNGSGAIYRQLADHIMDLVKTAQLNPGDRLPPHRELARLIGVNVTTVTRAIAVLQKNGVVESRAGRGSFIKSPGPKTVPRSGVNENSRLCDLSINRPAIDAYLKAAEHLLPTLVNDPRFPSVQDYHAPEGEYQTRKTIAEWLSSATGHNDPSRLVVVNGCQHGLSCVVDAVAQSGDVILADMVTFHGFIPLCASKGIKLKSVATDGGGMKPEALEEACQRHSPKAVFLMPNFHNPTNVTLSEARRDALAHVARKNNTYIIEDDVCHALLSNPLPTIASKHPDITFYVSSFSKSVAAGIRLGVVSAPVEETEAVSAMLRMNCWSTSALVGLVVTKLIEEGTIDTIISQQAQELKERHQILVETLPSEFLDSQPTSPFAWIRLPNPWRSETFSKAALNAGVCVLSGEAFNIDRDQAPVHAIRIYTNAARSQKELRLAAGIINNLLKSGHRKALFDV